MAFDLDAPSKTSLFRYYSPLNKFIGVLSIPHSGLAIPEDMKEFLSPDFDILKQDVDYKVDELIDIEAIRNAGVAVVAANMIRTSVDLNRTRDKAVLNWKQNTHGKAVVAKEPSDELYEKFRQHYYDPYFAMLKSLIEHLEALHTGAVSFIDLHSMPSRPTPYHMKQNPNQKQSRPDFCLSDNFGKTCVAEFIQTVDKSLSSSGYKCLINDPYIGGHITTFGDQFRTNNIQIEINRAIYMDESSFALTDNAKLLKGQLTACLIKTFQEFAKK